MKNAITKVSFLLTVVFGLSCCQPEKDQSRTAGAGGPAFSKTLVEVGIKSFELDSITPYYTGCLQFYKDANGDQYLCLLNSYTNTLYFYGYADGKVHHRLALEKEALAKAGKVQSFVVKSLDSVYVLADKDFFLLLLNRDGHVMNSNNLRFFSEGLTTRPLFIHRDKLYAGGHDVPGIDPFSELTDFASDNLVSIVDLTTQKISAALSYPESYKGGVWGPYLSQYYYTFNPSTEKFIFSFAADHRLYETDFSAAPTPHNAASQFFSDIPSWRATETDADARLKYYLSTPSYQGVIFDPYQNLYYRIALQPISADDLASNDPDKSGVKHASIIILDHNFTKIGETLLPRFSYTETMFFVAPDGLHLAKWEASKADDSKLVFGVFKLMDVQP
ncbi:DUF4221 family protein [Dawidia soli]|uniref:DUF4221 family protein n=1 Tax=Dawidia soli TaxID=2782352 RepID=A0AAP2DD50_9BACT|nr:DUF4221 family protein [Dawidia soli]MBT1689834.1 DUF4221 family protein [Dawidia soli]